MAYERHSEEHWCRLLVPNHPQYSVHMDSQVVCNVDTNCWSGKISNNNYSVMTLRLNFGHPIVRTTNVFKVCFGCVLYTKNYTVMDDTLSNHFNVTRGVRRCSDPASGPRVFTVPHDDSTVTNNVLVIYYTLVVMPDK